MKLHILAFKLFLPKVRLTRITALFVLALPLIASAEGQGKIEKRSYFFDKAEREIDYAIYVPHAYDGRAKLPLIVLLHGLGSNPHQVIRYSGITQEAEKRGYVVVAPYGYNERGWYGSRGKGKDGILFGEKSDPGNLGELSESDVFNVMRIVQKEFKIDDNRIYLMGHSMGGGGALYLGGKYPNLWAGIAPMAPAVFFDSSILEKMTQIPVYIVSGELDLLVPVGSVRRWVRQMEELKMDCYYNEIKGGDHASSITNNPTMIAEIYDFFDKRKTVSKTPLSENNQLRVFTNRSGVQIKASTQSVSEKKVTIVREDGRKFTLQISSLSDSDQDFLKKWQVQHDQSGFSPE
jgi:poly(3-hydroxybutyrate) depolymerase